MIARDEAPSGLPDEAEEAPPLGVPEDDGEDDGEPELPGIPTERTPPSTG